MNIKTMTYIFIFFVSCLGFTKSEIVKNKTSFDELDSISKINKESIKIVSFNIGMGARRKESNKQYFLDLTKSIPHLISFIKNEIVNSQDERMVICLQEVDFNKNRSGNKNFLKTLKSHLGVDWNYYYYDPSSEKNQKYGIGIITNLDGTVSGGKPKEQKWKVFDSDSEENRGAIAIKLKSGKNPIWIVNTHLGFINPASQIDKIINRIYTFDTNVPIAVCGDFNVPDLDYAYGERSKNNSLYKQTISKLENVGFFKSQIVGGAPQTFHSWNSKKNGIILDYIMTSYPYPNSVIEFLAPFKKVESKTPSTTIDSEKFYFSDHNAIIMDYTFD